MRNQENGEYRETPRVSLPAPAYRHGRRFCYIWIRALSAAPVRPAAQRGQEAWETR